MEHPRASFAWLFKSYYSQCFLNILEKISGEKDLIICPDVLNPLDLICSYSSLKSNGVVKIYKLEDGSAPGSTENRCYLVRNEASSTKIIANHINSNLTQNNTNVRYQIIFVPKRHSTCDQILEQEGVYGYVSFFEFPLCLIPLDSDIFSSEYPNCFKELFLNSDLSSLNYVSYIITQIKHLVGNIQRVHTLGKYAKTALKLSDYLSEGFVAEEDGFITDMVLIDRDVDYTSLLLSQLTYEGLLDEVYGIKCGKISVPPGILKDDDLVSGKCVANSSDVVYRDIRDYHLSATFARLKQKMQQLKAKQSERKEMNLNAIKGFVTNELKAIQSQHKSINIHITLSEFVLDKKKESEFAEQLEVENNIILGNDIKQCIQHIEEGIIRQFSKYTSLRLLSLLSLTEEGLSSKDYRHFVKLFLQSFGHDHMITLLNMKKMGLLFEQNLTNHILSPGSGGNNLLLNTKVVAAMSAFPRKSHFRATIKRLNLIPPVIDSGYNLSNPTDAGFVFGGVYIPMVCRLIETAIINNDKNQDELLKIFPGEYSCKELSKSGHRRKEKTVLVCFIGGVTFAEIAALRFLANKKRITILVTTTSIINGNIVMKQIGPEYK